MAVRRRPLNARSSGLWPLKWFNLAPQPSTASCHQMPLPISAVHHLPPLQSRSGAHAGVSMPLRDATPRPSVQQPHLGARRWRQQIPCAAGACSRAASLGVSLWSCKNFIVKVRPRSFSGLASPLLLGILSPLRSRTKTLLYSWMICKAWNWVLTTSLLLS